jgi:hypothetical protein
MLRGYLIRLTREYTDGGMDSHAEVEKRRHPRQNGGYCYQEHQIHFQRKCSLRRPCIAALSLTLIALASKP